MSNKTVTFSLDNPETEEMAGTSAVSLPPRILRVEIKIVTQTHRSTDRFVLTSQKDGWRTLNGKNVLLIRKHLAVVVHIANPNMPCVATC